MTPVVETIWIGSVGKRALRFFPPPTWINGAFPYVAAEDVVRLISPFPQAFEAYARAAADVKDVGSVMVETDDGPLLLIPHPHARALLTVSIEDGAPLDAALAAYLSAMESALVVYLAPMSAECREGWLTAFNAAHRDTANFTAGAA